MRGTGFREPLARWWQRRRAQPQLSVDFYTRSGCHLCELAEPLVRRLARLYHAKLNMVDVAGDPELCRRFGEKIPVVRIDDGNQVALRLTEPRLTRAFERARRRRCNQ